MNIHFGIRNLGTGLLLGMVMSAQAAITDISSSPLVSSASTSVLPNIMFILDDSGSMDWAYMPDWANVSNETLLKNSDFNGVAYNPGITYTPPTAYSTDGTIDTTTYPSQTGQSTSTGASSATKPNWRAVKNDGYGVQSTSTSNLEGNAYFYTIIAGEYCSDVSLRNCIAASTPSVTHPYPAKLRWCNSSANATAATPAAGSCQAVRIETGTNQFDNARVPSPRTATITVGNPSSGSVTNTTITSVKVNGQEILSATTTANTNINTVASAIRTNINNCTQALTGNCQVVGYSATVSGNVVTINAPGVISFTPSVTKGTGNMAISTTAFAASTSVPGSIVRTDIVAGVNSYPYPGSTTKASTRTDCVGTTCTYAEEMRNYANWWAYYHTRMQMMKTSTSIAFQPIGTNYRVGFMSINVNNSDYVGVTQFTASNKRTWYQKLFAANPNNGTPLQAALTAVGRYYAGKKATYTSPASGSSVAMSDDPVQYSCQQNFTILSTDGYWNSGVGKQLNGTTDIGNQDGSEARPMNDGTTTVTNTTATININSANNAKVTSIKVNGTEIMTGSTNSSGNVSTVASRVANNIGLAGFTAERSGTLITITAPASLNNLTAAPVVSYTGSLNMTITPFGTNFVTNTVGGASNTLADVAQYYYATDLRTSALGNCTGAVVSPATTGNDVCTNNVPISGLDAASTQHMTTFTLGLGASGYMQYLPSYTTASSGDFYNVKSGTAADPSGGVCAWQTSGSCNWPTPTENLQTTIDDLWHAAVNGRGTYFSATNPSSLATSLATALAGVSARTGSSAAATTSNPNITSGDNFVFSSTFTTQNWDGELVRQQLDLTTGVTSSTIDWAAQARLDSRSYTTRNIYTFSASATDKLKLFTWANLTATEQAYFTNPAVSTLSQFCAVGITCLSASDQTAAQGSNLVNYLRGDRTNEGVSTENTKYYRLRSHVLGDIVNAEAVYVKGSLFNYGDKGYSAFVTSNATRQGMVYVAANDGMLHAFYAADGTGTIQGGNEAWAYIPSLVLPKLYKLADKNYANLHEYFVDGTPVVSDICVSNCSVASTDPAVWKTILVGGLNGGGRGYYALDITDPLNPKALWEFTNTNMGYTYGNPKITKLKDGTWVVLVTSGYNNVAPGDGKGYLYVLNAATGALVTSVNSTGIITTGVGSGSGTTTPITTTVAGNSVTLCAASSGTPSACPSGLAQIAVKVVNTSSDNTAIAVYGGDLYGNLWRFDINNDIGASGYDAQLLATLRNSSGIQPITTKPELGTVNGSQIVYVGTGRYMGTSDLGDTSVQSIYGIKDPLATNTTPSTAIYDNPRTLTEFVQQTITITTCPAGSPSTICTTGQSVRTSSNNSVNFAADNGWFFDLPDTGERANTNPTLGLGTLGFTTNVPNSSACTVGGFAYRYFLDYRTGAAVTTSSTGVVGTLLGNALATRPVYVRLPNNTVVELTRLSDGTTVTSKVPIGGGVTATRRTSWRELISE